MDIKDYLTAARLRKYLEYELSPSMMVLLHALWGFALLLMVIAAVVFTPFMVSVLYLEKRYGWLLSFFLLVVLPTLVIFMSGISRTWKAIAEMVPLALFYLYCFVLRISIVDWDD